MTQIKCLHLWTVLSALAVIVCRSYCQTPCQRANCPSNTYCTERPDGSTSCILCDPACITCNGPGPELCLQCQIGNFKPSGQVQLCTPCDPGKYGVNCALTCHCLNNDLCNKTDGFCMGWKCDRGYTNLPYCQDFCPAGKFGIDCGYQCHCPDKDNCSRINGDCSSGHCALDWIGAGCQRRLPKLALPPQILDTRCGNITLLWNSFNETNDIGNGPVQQYNIYQMVNNSDGIIQPWQLAGSVQAQTNVIKNMFSVARDLLPGEGYNFRVDVVGQEFNKSLAQVSSGNPTDVVVNDCTTATTAKPENTTKTVTSQKVFSQVNITAFNNLDIVINWSVMPEFKDFNVTLTQQFLGNGDCDDVIESPVQIGPLGLAIGTAVLHEGISSWSRYMISITANSSTNDVSETYSQNLTTFPSIPLGTVTALKLDSITSTEAELSWGPVPCNQRKGPLISYELLVKSVKNSIFQELHNATEARLRLFNLTVYTNYSVQVRFRNVVGVGPQSQAFYFMTLEGVPGPVEITRFTPTYSTIVVSFAPVTQTNGIITSYTVTYSTFSDFRTHESVTQDAYVGLVFLKVSNLIPETIYYMKMAASTSAGMGPYGSVKQNQTLKAPPPLEPMTVELDSRTNSCLTIKWSPPAQILGSIISFVLEARKVTADLSTPPIRVNLNGSVTSYQMCQMRPSTLYSVEVSGITADGAYITATNTFSTEHGSPPRPVAPVLVRSSFTNITIAIEPVVSLDVPITAYQIQPFLLPANGKKKRFAGLPGYVAAELSPQDVTSRMEFIIGDKKIYGGYENKALQQEVYYMIYYVAISTINNDTTTSWSQLVAPVLTVPYDPSIVQTLSMSVASRSMTCLNFTWQLPQKMENSTTGFNLTVRRLGDNSAPIAARNFPPTQLSYQECDLTPYTTYTATVIARMSGGDSITSSKAFTTVQNTPRKPAPPVFVNATYTTIAVSIEPLILTDAPLTAYQLQVEAVSSGRRKRVTDVPGYVTAQLSENYVTRKMDFIIGDDKDYGGHRNKPLLKETLYKVHYVVISSANGVDKFSYSSLSPPVKTIPSMNLPANQDDDIDIYVIVIIALAFFVLLVLFMIISYCCWRRNRFKPYEVQEDYKTPGGIRKPKTDYEPEKYWSAAYNLKDSRHIIAGRNLVYGQEYHEFNKENAAHSTLLKLSFADEFQSLPHKFRRATDNVAQRNKDVNRFPHLLPYDQSLVKLKPDSDSMRTYINASFIPGYKKGPSYIAAQSPFDERTVLDFWRLIYQRSIKTVVMITGLVEDKIIKCTQYWPETKEASYGNFLLQLNEVRKFSDFTIRTISVKSRKDQHFRIVKLFEFTSWPDHGVPDDPIPFLEMRYKVRRYHHDGPGPILVHCGTGMGRTGVFVAVDALIEQYAAEGRVRVLDFVRRIRRARPYMVRTKKQYAFIYECIFEEFHAGDTLVDFNLKERYHMWSQKNPNTRHTYLRDQHELLEKFTRAPLKEEFKTALLEVNLQKNRYQDVLPTERHRPHLKSQGGPDPTDYINALFLDSYFRKNQFIITQTPLHTTIIDFWKLVYDYDVHTIVMLEDFKNEDSTCAEYWPNMNLKHFEPFFIEMTATYQHDSITIRNFRIRSTQHPKDPAKHVRQFQFNSFNRSSLLPPSRAMILDLIDGVFAWQDEVCQNEWPVIVHCQDGFSHSGLFAILAILCEKMEEDEEVDVYRMIKHCKRRRTQFIRNYEQFRYCYKTLWDFVQLRLTGGTFTDTFQENKDSQKFQEKKDIKPFYETSSSLSSDDKYTSETTEI